MGPLLDRSGRLADAVPDPRDYPAGERLGSRVGPVDLLGPLMAFVRWGHR